MTEIDEMLDTFLLGVNCELDSLAESLGVVRRSIILRMAGHVVSAEWDAPFRRLRPDQKKVTFKFKRRII